MTDITITNSDGCGFYVIAAETRAGHAWLKRHVPDQERGVAYTDDSRCAWDIYQAMLADGLEVA